jgi:hypothetical protein
LLVLVEDAGRCRGAGHPRGECRDPIAARQGREQQRRNRKSATPTRQSPRRRRPHRDIRRSNGLDIRQKLAGGLAPLLRVPLQRFRYDVAKRLPHALERHDIVVHDFIEDGGSARSVEDPLARQHFQQYDPE